MNCLPMEAVVIFTASTGGQDWHDLYSSEVVDLHKDTQIQVMKPILREV